MNVFKGTPGPWEKHVRKGRIHAVIPKYYGERRLETVLHLGTIHDDDCGVETCCCVEEHANARLIAAAPELLDALKLILPMAKAFAHLNDVGANKELLELAESVIEKVLGSEVTHV